MLRSALGLLVAVCLTGCPSETCTPLETRCNGAVAEICGDDQRWQAFEDCAQVSQQSGQAFSCCYQAGDDDAGLPGGHTCVPDNQCEQ